MARDGFSMGGSAPKRTLESRFWSKVDKNGPEVRDGLGRCWVWTGAKHSHGYGMFGVGKRVMTAHRVSWELAHGAITETNGNNGTCVCHRCDNTSCVNPAHLFLGTHRANMHDMASKLRTPHVLDAEAVREMRRLRAEGTGLRELAERFGVSQARVSQICLRRAWAHVA